MAVSNRLAASRIVMLILLAYPILLLTVKGGMNGAFFLLVIVALFYLFRAPRPPAKELWDSYSIAFAAAMASPLVAVFLSQAYHGNLTPPAYDGPSRFLLAVPVFLALRQMEMRTFTALQYGLPLGALAALVSVLVIPRDWKDHPLASQFSNHIHYGDSALMLGILSVLSIHWAQRDRFPVLALKVCGLAAGLYLSAQSGARGGWAAIPVFVVLWVLLSRHPGKPWRKLAIGAASVTLVAVLSYAFVETVQDKANMIYSDLGNFVHGQKDTSLGIRLQLWGAALHLFAEYPVFGVGPGGFAQAMGPLSEGGIITQAAAGYGRGEVHSEILAKAAGLGIFGLLSILSVYFVPLAIFIRAARSAAGPARKAAFMGICFVVGFFIFGLSVEIFNLKMTAAFYSLTVAVLLAAAAHKGTSQESHV